MGEIQINTSVMQVLKQIEVKQVLKEASHVSIAWVSKAGIWGMSGGYGHSLTLYY